MSQTEFYLTEEIGSTLGQCAKADNVVLGLEFYKMERFDEETIKLLSGGIEICDGYKREAKKDVNDKEILEAKSKLEQIIQKVKNNLQSSKEEILSLQNFFYNVGAHYLRLARPAMRQLEDLERLDAPGLALN